eukprot:SAG25_NODE_11_length_28117_cov_24.264901_4_plen_161_part_00
MYLEFLNRKQTVPKVQLETPNTGNAALETATRIEGELQLLHTRPEFFIGKDVFMRWIQDGKDYGVVHGKVINIDADKHDDGAQLWGIQWDDDTRSDYTLADMQKFCVQLMDGDRSKKEGTARRKDVPRCQLGGAPSRAKVSWSWRACVAARPGCQEGPQS